MKILLSSANYLPSVGGLEVASFLLAREFAARGHQVVIVTRTEADVKEEEIAPFAVHRRPSPGKLLELVRWCDVFFHNNSSVFAAWPLLMVRRPWIIAHQCWLPRRGEIDGYRGALKRVLLPLAHNIAISNAVARDLSVPSIVIENPYDDQLFRAVNSVERERGLIFVGRLVRDKGVHILLRALAALAADLKQPACTIVGDGPCRKELESQARELGVAGQVTFIGSRQGPELVELLNQHRIMVVPSTWEEPFGIVALEGMACGCLVIASESGGLVDAVGALGLTFPKGDFLALADVLAHSLNAPNGFDSQRAKREEHLRRHSSGFVAEKYLEVFEGALGRRALRSPA